MAAFSLPAPSPRLSCVLPSPSPHPPALPAPAQAEAVLLLADALSIPRFNWLGWSSGGNTGLVLAALHGERLGRMASHAGMAGGPSTSELGGGGEGRRANVATDLHSDTSGMQCTGVRRRPTFLLMCPLDGLPSPPSRAACIRDAGPSAVAVSGADPGAHLPTRQRRSVKHLVLLLCA